MINAQRYNDDMRSLTTALNEVAARIRQLEAVQIPMAGVFGPHDILSATHIDTTVAAIVRGDLMTGQGVAPTWTRLAIGAVGTVLASDGTDAAWVAAPAAVAHNLLSATHIDSVVNGATRGSLVYGNATPAWDELVHPGAANRILRTPDANDISWSDWSLVGTAGQTYTFGTVGGTIPTAAGTLTTATANNITAAGVITHAITTTADGAANHSTILASSAAGALTMDDYFTIDGGTFGITGNELLTVNAAGTFAFSGISGVTVEDADWIGNSAATARLGFDSSGATDYAYFSGCNVGINVVSPAAIVTIYSSTAFSTALSGSTSTLYLRNDNVGGSGAYGASIGFGRVASSVGNERNASIVAVQTEADADSNGLAFFAHGPTYADPIFEVFRYDHAGDIGVGVTTILAQLHIDQSAAAGAQPVLYLDQGDASEQHIVCSMNGADQDFPAIIEVDVTGSPTLWWDESEDSFAWNKDLIISTLTASTVIYADATKAITSLANAAGYLTNNGAGALSWSATATPTAHALLSASHSDAAVDAVSVGSLIYGNATLLWDELVHPGAANRVLQSSAAEVAWSANAVTFPAAGAVPVGSGAATRVAYWSAANTLASDAGLTVDTAGDGYVVADGGYIGITGDVRIVFDSTNGYIEATLGDAAGADEFQVVDSGAAVVANIDSFGNGYFAGNVGIGVAANTAHRLRVYNNAIDTTATYYGITSDLIKTAGATDAADNLYGIYSSADFNQVGGTLGTVWGIYGEGAITSGTVTTARGIHGLVGLDGGTAGGVFSAMGYADLNTGTASGVVFGAGAYVDIEAGMTGVTGPVYGVYIWVDDDFGATNPTYMLYLDEQTGVDYGIYQNGTADNYFGGDIGVGITTPVARLDVGQPIDGWAIIAGANLLSNDARTDATRKYTRIGMPHYTNAEEPTTLIVGDSGNTTANVNIGGGSTFGNIVTLVRFHTAANTTTTGESERMRIDSAGAVFIDETANGNMTQGLTINQGANDDEIFDLKSSDVAHGATDVTETDSYYFIKKQDASAGGARCVGMRDADGVAGFALHLQGFLGENADTTKTVDGIAPVVIGGHITSGASISNMNADGNVCVFRTMRGGAYETVALIDEDGDFYYDGALNNYDDFDDALALQDARAVLTGRWNDALTYNAEALAKMGVLSLNRDGTPAMVSHKRMTALMAGAIGQLYNRVLELEQKLAA